MILFNSRLIYSHSIIRRLYSSSSSSNYSDGVIKIGIRREDLSRKWERRSPLTPLAVQSILDNKQGGVEIEVESCKKRIYLDKEFKIVGAKIVESLTSDCSIILGIKEIPINLLRSSTTHLFFSHTHKGQSYNLPLLSAMLEKKGSRFIDYELLTSSSSDGGKKGKRTTGFGYEAGIAGMSDALSNLGTKLLAEGYATPLLQLQRPFMSPSLICLKQSLARVGLAVGERGMGRVVTVVVTGKGRVGEGAREVLDCLGVKWVRPGELKGLYDNPQTNLNQIYATHLDLSDYLISSSSPSTPFDRESYRADPSAYTSNFHSTIAPYTTLLLNGAFWEKGCPVLMSLNQLKELKKGKEGEGRFLAVADVACDFDEGALEFIKSATTIDDPVIQFDPTTGQSYKGEPKIGTVQLSSIEILPSQLPLDASNQFSTSLLPYINSLIIDPTSSSTSDPLAVALRRATIVEDGKLGKDYEGLDKILKAGKRTMKKVVMLGSGLVAGPAVEILAARKDIELIIASNSLESAQGLAKGHSTVSAVQLDASDMKAVEELVKTADVVISLLPATLHFRVAEVCVSHGTHFVTASYVSSDMAFLDLVAKASGVIILSELGLDPGIDHMSAMKLIEDARKEGLKITSFTSFCGGLPAPEISNGPLGYKFSWSPRGVLTAALNDASYRIENRQVDIPGSVLLTNKFPSVPIIRGFNLEGVANRNSLFYLKEYGLKKDLATILRGTLRYKGFSAIVDIWKKLGLLSTEVMKSKLERWDQFVDVCLIGEKGPTLFTHMSLRKTFITQKIGYGDSKEVALALDTLEQLSLLPSSKSTSTPSRTLPPLPTTPQSPLDLLSILLASELAYEPNERDMVILHHELGTLNKQGEKELFTSTLVQYGIPGAASAMATTVGMPIALGALLCLDGKISKRGIVSPASSEVWKPLLIELEKNGVRMVEKRIEGSDGVLDTLKDVHPYGEIKTEERRY